MEIMKYVNQIDKETQTQFSVITVKIDEGCYFISFRGADNTLIGGHSKGGNLAVYASSFCSNDIQDRIGKVYNYDDPGFDEKYC